MPAMKITTTLFTFCLLIASINCRPNLSNLKDVVDLHDKRDIKTLIGLLKEYLHTKSQTEQPELEQQPAVLGSDDDEEEGTNAIVEEEERSQALEEEEERSQVLGSSDFQEEEIRNSNADNPIVIQEASVSNSNVRKLKYKVVFWTFDHARPEVKKWMRKGLDAWTNPEISAHLREHGCPTLEFEETEGDDYDFKINFDIAWFRKHQATDYLSYFFKKDSTLYINDEMPLRREWIAHAIAYDTCDMLGCKCTLHSYNEIMTCGPDNWLRYTSTVHDYRTMGAALGCQTHKKYL